MTNHNGLEEVLSFLESSLDYSTIDYGNLQRDAMTHPYDFLGQYPERNLSFTAMDENFNLQQFFAVVYTDSSKIGQSGIRTHINETSGEGYHYLPIFRKGANSEGYAIFFQRVRDRGIRNKLLKEGYSNNKVNSFRRLLVAEREILRKTGQVTYFNPRTKQFETYTFEPIDLENRVYNPVTCLKQADFIVEPQKKSHELFAIIVEESKKLLKKGEQLVLI